MEERRDFLGDKQRIYISLGKKRSKETPIGFVGATIKHRIMGKNHPRAGAHTKIYLFLVRRI